MPLKDSAAGRHTCWRFFYAAGFRPGGGHVRKSGSGGMCENPTNDAQPRAQPYAHLAPAPRPPALRPAPTWPPHCAHLAPALRPVLRPPAPRPAPTWPACRIHDTCKDRHGHANTRPPARNHVPYPASRDIPRRCLAYTQLLRLCSCRTCTHPFIKQLPLYALRQDVTRAELFGTPWACPCSGVRTGTDF